MQPDAAAAACSGGCDDDDLAAVVDAAAVRVAYSKIEALPFDEKPVALHFLARFARDNGTTMAEADRLAFEYRRFLAIKAVRGRAVPPPAIDSVFHQHLTFTRSYTRFCDVLGLGFVHHEPCEGGDGEAMAATYGRTRALYAAAFGAAPPVDVWIESGENFKRTAIVPVRELRSLRRDAASWRSHLDAAAPSA
jgi:hypothetical protein